MTHQTRNRGKLEFGQIVWPEATVTKVWEEDHPLDEHSKVTVQLRSTGHRETTEAQFLLVRP